MARRRISTKRVVLFVLVAFSIASCLGMLKRFLQAAVPGLTADPADLCENSCPDGWTKRLNWSPWTAASECCMCDAPASYSGPCDTHSQFLTKRNGHTWTSDTLQNPSRSERIKWANSCQVRWSACDYGRGSPDEEAVPSIAITVQPATIAHDNPLEPAKCHRYMTGEGCGWTNQWNCPDQTGSPEKAGDDGSLGYDCCCNKGFWTVEAVWRPPNADENGSDMITHHMENDMNAITAEDEAAAVLKDGSWTVLQADPDRATIAQVIAAKDAAQAALSKRHQKSAEHHWAEQSQKKLKKEAAVLKDGVWRIRKAMLQADPDRATIAQVIAETKIKPIAHAKEAEETKINEEEQTTTDPPVMAPVLKAAANPALHYKSLSKPPDPKHPEHPTGFIKAPRVRAGDRKHDDGLLHIIFSSGCTWFQHWQAELLLGSAFKVGQRGRITRIVSGCYSNHIEGEIDPSLLKGKGIMKSHSLVDDENMVPLSELMSSVHEDFGLFVTPSFAGASEFPWMNKANSINYFMQHSKEELDREGETVIAVLDPDFLFVSPMTQAPAKLEDIIQLVPSAVEKWNGKGEPINVVKPGRPVGQRYDMGGAWVQNYDMKTLTGDPNTKAATYTPAMMRKYLDVGPPFMVHRTDMVPLAKLWATYMHGVLAQSKKVLLESDMHAYNMAAAHLGLKHTLLESYMISFSKTDNYNGEAWQWIDPMLGMNLNCNDPDSLVGKHLPTAAPDGRIPVLVAKDGCHVIHDEAQCVRSVDGRSGTPFAEKHKLNGEACAWCCGEACVTDGNKCEPHSWVEGMPSFSWRFRYITTTTESRDSLRSGTTTTTKAALIDTCSRSVQSFDLKGKYPMPSVLHMAHNYKSPVRTGWPKEWMFHKVIQLVP